MKTKIILPFFLAIIILSFSAYATISCEITDAAACTEPSKIVLKLSDLSDGGSHAGTKDDPFYTKAVCCSGVAGLDSTETDDGSPYKEKMISITEGDGHAAKTKLEGYTQINLTAPTELTCAYMDTDCLPSFETCLFSISGDSDAHISTCNAAQGYVYPNKYCCRTGEATCRVTDFYWGVFDEITGFQILSGTTEPLGPVGLGIDVYLIAETSGCSGTTADFTVYTKEGSVWNSSSTLQNIPMGRFKIGTESGELEDEFENPISNVVLAAWTGGSGKSTSKIGEYKFKISLTKPSPGPYTFNSEFSQRVKVDSCLTELNETWFTESCRLALPIICGDTCTWDDSYGYKYSTKCIDTDCDEVPDCIDEFEGTVTDPDLVNRCSGVTAGTAGCVPAMDCTMLTWSSCANCETGEPCNTEGGFEAGTMFMERCEGVGQEKCDCEWTGTPPPGCIDVPYDGFYGVLNQYNNRFKECIEDEEFPLFDGFNIIAVLLILSMYYTIAIIRKKK